MNKAYWTAPFVALLVFGGVYLNFKSDYAAREKKREEQILSEKQGRLRAEIEARRKAVDAAVLAQVERQKARAAKEAAERVRKDARQAALDARDAALHEQERLSKQIDGLKKDIAAEQESITRINLERQESFEELAFLKTYVGKARDNVAALQEVLAKIIAAESARAATDAQKKH